MVTIEEKKVPIVMTQEGHTADVLTLHPYRNSDKGSWAFDDQRTGLHREPFVRGITEMIDRVVAVKRIPNANRGITLTFAHTPFDGCDVKLLLQRPEGGGNWYAGDVLGEHMEGWLSPALFLYFRQAPRELYVRCEPLDQDQTGDVLTPGSSRERRVFVECEPLHQTADVLTLHPYRRPHERSWAFDDQRTGLYREAFVRGITEMIDRVVEVKGIANANRGVTLTISRTPFDGHDARLLWQKVEHDWNMHAWNMYAGEVCGEHMEGWLCPALLQYFPEAPRELYVRCEPLHAGVNPVEVPTDGNFRRYADPERSE